MCLRGNSLQPGRLNRRGDSISNCQPRNMTHRTGSLTFQCVHCAEIYREKASGAQAARRELLKHLAPVRPFRGARAVDHRGIIAPDRAGDPARVLAAEGQNRQAHDANAEVALVENGIRALRLPSCRTRGTLCTQSVFPLLLDRPFRYTARYYGVSGFVVSGIPTTVLRTPNKAVGNTVAIAAISVSNRFRFFLAYSNISSIPIGTFSASLIKATLSICSWVIAFFERKPTILAKAITDSRISDSASDSMVIRKTATIAIAYLFLRAI